MVACPNDNTKYSIPGFGSFGNTKKTPVRLTLAEQRFGQLRQFHRGQFDRWPFGVDCLLTAGDVRDEQHALRWKAARKVQQLKLASLVHGGG